MKVILFALAVTTWKQTACRQWPATSAASNHMTEYNCTLKTKVKINYSGTIVISIYIPNIIPPSSLLIPCEIHPSLRGQPHPLTMSIQSAGRGASQGAGPSATDRTAAGPPRWRPPLLPPGTAPPDARQRGRCFPFPQCAPSYTLVISHSGSRVLSSFGQDCGPRVFDCGFGWTDQGRLSRKSVAMRVLVSD